MIGQILLHGILILLLVLLGVLLLVCLSSVVVKISYWDKKFDWKLEFLGIPVLLLLGKKRGTDEAADTAKTEERHKKKAGKRKKKKETGKQKKKLLADKILESFYHFVSTMDMAGNACAALPSTVEKFLKAVSWCNICTDIIVGDEDAFLCARNYGLFQAGIQNLLAQAGRIMRVKRKDICISCDFTRDETVLNIRFTCKLHVGKTLLAGVTFLLGYLSYRCKGNRAVKKSEL